MSDSSLRPGYVFEVNLSGTETGVHLRMKWGLIHAIQWMLQAVSKVLLEIHNARVGCTIHSGSVEAIHSG